MQVWGLSMALGREPRGHGEQAAEPASRPGTCSHQASVPSEKLRDSALSPSLKRCGVHAAQRSGLLNSKK